MTPDEIKIGQVANRLIKASEHLLNDTNRLVLHEPITRGEAIQEHDAIIAQIESMLLIAKDWKHEVTGRF
ncbi:hypothetical protein ACW19A_08340 [Limosilactobacillus fermentum]|uniref:hypothetical protein n=1 Tax=Limosilactobacillus fermentum TaxID=1613 RepID=UPI001880CF1F|nr:hypothetical protein [Limosilactobacillus fermentum]MBE8118765.1 hypothetical protein [Limosilactobacillus fermentum]